MQYRDYLSANTISANTPNISSKKQVLELISQMACRQDEDINYVEVLQALIQRERIGSTVIGHGVAIPHARIPELTQPICCLITLQTAINFDADNPTAIDIVFSLLVPNKATEEHLQLLSTLSTRLQDKSFRDALRNAKTNEALISLH